MDTHWRNSQKIPRFFFVDARVTLALLLFVVHWAYWTLGTAVVVIAFFWILERRGLTFEAALRAFRSWIFGHKRPGCVRLRRRRWTDYG